MFPPAITAVISSTPQHFEYAIHILFINKLFRTIKICKLVFCVISGFRREVDENYRRLGYYGASGGNYLPTFRENLSAPIFCFLTPEDGNYRLSRNVGKELTLLTV